MIKKNAIMESPREHLSPFSEEAIALWGTFFVQSHTHTRTRVDLNMMMLKRLADSSVSIYFKTWKVLDRTDQDSVKELLLRGRGGV